jgi:hypothetical protein
MGEGDAMTGDTGMPDRHGAADHAWRAHLTQRWGHFGPVLLCGSIGAVILLGLHPLSGPLALTVPLAVVLFVLASWLLMRQHDRRLCELCAASLPLNPGEQAARYQRRFWVAHAGSQPRYLIPYLAVLLGSNFAATTAGRIGWAIVQASMIYLIAAYSTHRRLQPWCPWCRGDGGGEHEDTAPGPLPDDRRQLV